MARYINLDKQLVRLYLLNLTCEDVIKEFLLSAETADVVEVVRCKDCQYWKTETEPIGIECEPGEDAHYCDMDGMITRTADFCNYGRRRDDDRNG